MPRPPRLPWHPLISPEFSASGCNGHETVHQRPKTVGGRELRRRMAAEVWGGGGGGESAKLPPGTPRFRYKPFYAGDADGEWKVGEKKHFVQYI